MPTHSSEPAVDGASSPVCEKERRSPLVPLVISVLAVIWFYAFELRYGGGSYQSAFDWIWSAWNSDTDYEHGPLFPLVIAGLVFHRFDRLKAAVGEPCVWGLLAVLVGAMFYAAACDDGGATVHPLGWRFLPVGVARCENVVVSAVFLLACHSLAEFPAGDHSSSIDRNFHGPSRSWIVRRGDHCARHGDFLCPRRVGSVGNRQGMQRDSLAHGAVNDFSCLGLHRGYVTLEARLVVPFRVSPRHSWKRPARDLDFRHRGIW